MAWSFSEKTKFTAAGGVTPFTKAEQDTIIATMQTAYNGSGNARTMFENWIATGNVIEIEKVPNAFQALRNTGHVQIDLSLLTNATYIGTNGTVAKDTLLTALIHELGHAMTGKRDGTNGAATLDYTKPDYKGDNVNFVNPIYTDLGLPEQISYIAYDPSGSFHKPVGYKYTNGSPIDVAVTMEPGTDYGATGNFNSANSSNTRDLLIGDSRSNILQSGGGNDFLVGGFGNDQLNGGDGKNTAVFFGSNPADYDIRKNADGSWTVRHVRGVHNEGTDTLKNIQVLQFDQTQHYDLKKGGLTFETDFAFVIDTTGSMFDSIDAVKAQGTQIINALFADGKVDARVGVVGFKDTTYGEPSSIILKFTDQDDFAARKTAAINAINSISVGGGGDLPETDDDGLLHALNGDMGQWRVGAGIHRIALFTDAEVKDVGLRAQVTALAADLGATITKSVSITGTGGAVDTFEFAFAVDESGTGKRSEPGDPNGDAPTTPLRDDPIAADPTKATLQIFTIFTGPLGTDTSGLSDIALKTGGSSFTADSGDELVKKLLEIIKLPAISTHASSDFNFDGNSDVLWRHSGGLVAEWQMNGDQIAANLSVAAPDNSWKFQDTGDFGGDGMSDVMWRHSTGQVVLWQMNGDKIVSNTAIVDVSNQYHVQGIGDFGGDGKSDVLFRHDVGQVVVWQMNGDRIVSNTAILDVSRQYHIEGVGDFGGDGRSDVLWRHDNGQVVLWQMNGDKIAQNTAVANVSQQYKVQGIGDLNGDGMSDVVWRHDSGQIVLWQMNGDKIVSNTQILDVSNQYKIQDVRDYNGDGMSDILLRHDAGQVVMWTMNGDKIASNVAVATVGTDWAIQSHHFDLM